MPVDPEHDSQEDTLNLLGILREVREHWGLVRKITLTFLGLGILVALVSPVEFEAEAELMPELQKSESGASQLLEQYGGALGLGGLSAMSGGQDEEGVIPTAVYPRIVQSLTFQDSLLRHEVAFTQPDTTVDLYSYFTRHYEKSVFEWILWNTVEVPGRIARALSDQGLPERIRRRLEEENLESLTYEQFRAIQQLRDRVFVSLNPETGVLLVTAELPDAAASAQVCNRTIGMLTEYLKEYRTQKAREDLRFQEEQLEQAYKQFRQAQEALTEFRSQNVTISSPSLRAKEDRLRYEFDLAFDLYTTASQQRAEAQRKLQQETPVFKVIQEASVPMQNSKPRRVATIIGFLFAGLAVSYFYIAGRRIYRELQAKL